MPRMNRNQARALYRKRVRAAMQRADQAFRGQYAEEINELLGLSREEIDEITTDNSDLAIYNQLIEVVKEASRVNLEQAELVNRIRAMGEVAVTIAQKSVKLAAIVV